MDISFSYSDQTNTSVMDLFLCKFEQTETLVMEIFLVLWAGWVIYISLCNSDQT